MLDLAFQTFARLAGQSAKAQVEAELLALVTDKVEGGEDRLTFGLA